MEGIFSGLGVMSMLVVLVMFLVIVAMFVDFVSGWRKAKIRGDEHTSYAASRSLTKFLIYEGIVIICGCMDLMVHFAWFQLMDGVYMIPLLTILTGIVLCAVEAWSVKEKAEKKARKRMDDATAALAAVLDKDTVLELLKERAKAMKHPDPDGETSDTVAKERTDLNMDDF